MVQSKVRNFKRYGNLVRINPAQTLSLGFLCLIAIGTLLLMLPFATKDRHQLSFIDALLVELKLQRVSLSYLLFGP
jgi:trk system potassium uptake protein TrkH